MKRKLSILLFIIVVTLINCTALRKTRERPVADEQKSGYHNMDQAQQIKAVKHLTEEEGTNGMTIFETKCGSCHDLPAPDSRDFNSWLVIMKTMSVKAKLSSEQERLVMGYLYAINNSK